MALMMRSHSSARDWQPHSPSSGTYRSSFCSSPVSGTLVPSSSGNVAVPNDISRCHINTSTRKIFGRHYHDLPSSGTGSISQGLIFSVSPLSQLRKKKGCDNNTFAITHFSASPICDFSVQLMSIVSWSSQGTICLLLFGRKQILIPYQPPKRNTLSKLGSKFKFVQSLDSLR